MYYNKYKNKKTKIDGITFDSKKEASRYAELKILLSSGEIYDLQLQPHFELQPRFKIGKKTIRKIEYIADFAYYDEYGTYIVEDVKGIKTDVFKIKEKMFRYRYKNINLKLI